MLSPLLILELVLEKENSEIKKKNINILLKRLY